MMVVSFMGIHTQCLVTAYYDSDYVGYVDSMRSMTGYASIVCGSVVKWKATLQAIVSLSTNEAVYMH